MAAINGHLINAARTRLAKVVNKLYAIIDSLPADERLSKRQLAEIFGTVGTLMGLFNTFEIKRIAAGEGENRKKINAVIDITKLNIFKSRQTSFQTLSQLRCKITLLNSTVKSNEPWTTQTKQSQESPTWFNKHKTKYFQWTC